MKILLLLLLPLLGLSGCTNQELDNSPIQPPTENEQYIRTALSIVVSDNDHVNTRATAIEEGQLDLTNIWVLIFDNAQRLVQFPTLATPTGSTLYVAMKATTQSRRIFVAGNLTGAQTDYFAQKNNFALGTTTYNDIANNALFLTPPIDADGVPVGAGHPIPMFSEEITLATGTAAIHTLTPVMKRIVAKINLSAYYINTNDFKVEGLTVVNAPLGGQLFQRTMLPTHLGGTVRYNEAATVVGNKIESQIYLYENNGMNGATPNPIKLILRGKYKGSTTDSFYRLDLLNTTGTPPFSPYSVTRNTLYTIYVGAVESPGYDTFDEALSNTPFNNIDCNVTVTDPDIQDIVSNGEYYLGTTNSEYIVYADDLQTNLTAALVTTNAPGALTINRVTTSGGITCPISAIALPTTPGIDAKTELQVTLPPTFTTSDEGRIDIRLGVLSKTIKIRRRPSFPSSAGVMSDFGTSTYVSAAILSPGASTSWLQLSKVPTVTDAAIQLSNNIDYSSTGIHLQILNDNTNTPTQRTAEVYLSRNSGSDGRVKVYFVQQ